MIVLAKWRHAFLSKISCLRFIHQSTSEHPVYITTPIFYVNAAPHVGHLYTGFLADTLKRWNLLCGRPTVLSTGTDEHGLKIQQAAKKAGLDPQEFCDQNSTKFRQLFDLGNISYDVFLRTTQTDHKAAVQHIWSELEKRNALFLGQYSGWYSVNDEAFVPEAHVIQRSISPNETAMHSVDSGHRVEWITEENFKFPVSRYREAILDWLDSQRPVLPVSRHREVVSLLENSDSPDLSVSRLSDKLTWGIPVPNHPNHTVYVWLDALTSYLTSIGYPNHLRAADIHIVGKDILKFHAVYWISFLMSLKYPLPKKIVAHAHWTMDKIKMSKSLGNVVDPMKLLHTYGSDAVRYYMLKEASLSDDTDFSEEALIRHYNGDLADQLGNLLFRVVHPKFVPQHAVPSSYKPLSAIDQALLAIFSSLPEKLTQAYEAVDLSLVVSHLNDALAHLNRYFTANAPWKESSPERLNTVIYMTLEAYRILSVLYSPLLPMTAPTLLDRLGIPANERTFEHARWSWQQINRSLGPAIPAPFPRRSKEVPL